MYFILTASPKAFFIVKNNKDVVITSDYTKATKFKIVGEAIKSASEINLSLGSPVVKFQTIYPSFL